MITSLTGLLLWGTTGAALAATGWKKNRLLIAIGALIILGSPWLLGLLSTPSLATAGLACGLLLKQKLRPALAGWLLISGLALYTSALGAWAFDVYALGYAPQMLLIWCAISLALAWQQGHKALALAWLLALALFPLGALESVNLWDALLDPMAMMTGGFALLLGLKRK